MVEINITEKELEDFLCKDDNLENYLGITFVARQVKIEEFGYLDILGYNKITEKFVLIELKKGMLDASAYLQIERYNKAFSLKYNREFDKLIIGDNLHSDLHHQVQYYECDEEKPCVTYRLYKIEFEDGITFRVYSVGQKKLQEAYESLEGFADRKSFIRYQFNKQNANLENKGVVQ